MHVHPAGACACNPLPVMLQHIATQQFVDYMPRPAPQRCATPSSLSMFCAVMTRPRAAKRTASSRTTRSKQQQQTRLAHLSQKRSQPAAAAAAKKLAMPRQLRHQQTATSPILPQRQVTLASCVAVHPLIDPTVCDPTMCDMSSRCSANGVCFFCSARRPLPHGMPCKGSCAFLI